MESTIQELKTLVDQFSKKFLAILEQDFSAKPNPIKWSRKEVVGHLIDSGQNNLRRFIVGQYEDQPNVLYEQDFWVKANDYQNQNSEEVIQLWRSINIQICSILSSMPKENYAKMCDTGRGSPNLHSIEWLAEDYVKHMKHHINQVIAGSFDIKYP